MINAEFEETYLAALLHLFMDIIHHSIRPIQIDRLVHINLASNTTALLLVSYTLYTDSKGNSP